jgi:hypothetical protein
MALIHEEALMAAIAFNAAERAAERLETVLTAVGERFDVFVDHPMRQAADEAEPVRAQQADKLASTTPFRPLDASIVSDAIPAFFIGLNGEGFWVAREAKGRIGGLFLLRASAVSFARNQSGPTGCATVFPTGGFELDLENSGNPLVPCLRPPMRLALHLRRQATAFVGQITSAITRCRKA